MLQQCCLFFLISFLHTVFCFKWRILLAHTHTHLHPFTTYPHPRIHTHTSTSTSTSAHQVDLASLSPRTLRVLETTLRRRRDPKRQRSGVLRWCGVKEWCERVMWKSDVKEWCDVRMKELLKPFEYFTVVMMRWEWDLGDCSFIRSNTSVVIIVCFSYRCSSCFCNIKNFFSLSFKFYRRWVNH